MADRKLAVIVVPMVMGVLAIIAVFLRLKARRIKRAPIEADDYTILAALLFSLGICATNVIGAVLGNMGGHELGPNGKPVIIADEYIIRSQTLWIVQWSAALGEGFTKISVLLFYRRIFLGKVFLISTWFVMGLCVMWTISFFFANFFACRSVTAYWALPSAGVKCINLLQMLYSMTISDILTDVMILVLPWYPVYHLNMSLRQRLSVCAIFLLGGFVVAAGIIRVVFLSEGVKQGPDNSYTKAPAFYWAAIEACVGIISACLPIMRPLFTGVTSESIIGTLQTKLSGSRGKLVDHGVPRSSRSGHGNEVLKPSPVYSGKPKGLNEYQEYDASVEAMLMHSVTDPAGGILVQSSFSSRNNPA